MKILLILLLTYNLFAVDATLKIEKDVENRTRIGLVDSSNIKNSTLFNIFLADLKISGHFLGDKKYHKGDIHTNSIGSGLKKNEYVLKYKFSQLNNSKLSVRLLKTSNNSEIFKKTYVIPSISKLPFLAHKAISAINDVLHYPSINWINNYVIFSRYSNPGQSEILLADYTFHYMKVIIRGGLNLFPIWADKKQKSFYYSSYSGNIPTLYKINIYTGKKEKIVSSEGMLVCTDINSNGTKLLLTMAPEGQPDIYEYSIDSKSKKRITKFNGIDVSGKYVDDDSRIVFISNRLGYANLFKKSIDKSGVSQIVYHGHNNNSVDTSNKYIVYSSRESKHTFGMNTFNLYMANSNGSNTRPLTTTGSNQFPRFSKDGDIILYIKHTSKASSVGYINIHSHQSLLFPLYGKKVQSIDW